MSSVRRVGTAPELAVASLLDAMRVQYVSDDSSLPGRPDFYLPVNRLAVFVHGCFWHRHKGCPAASMPKSNTDYWAKKFQDNIRRDSRVAKQLKEVGVRCMIVWQCQTKTLPNLRRRMRRALAVSRQ